jgi:hypothetical protein
MPLEVDVYDVERELKEVLMRLSRARENLRYSLKLMDMSTLNYVWHDILAAYQIMSALYAMGAQELQRRIREHVGGLPREDGGNGGREEPEGSGKDSL